MVVSDVTSSLYLKHCGDCCGGDKQTNETNLRTGRSNVCSFYCIRLTRLGFWLWQHKQWTQCCLSSMESRQAGNLSPPLESDVRARFRWSTPSSAPPWARSCWPAPPCQRPWRPHPRCPPGCSRTRPCAAWWLYQLAQLLKKKLAKSPPLSSNPQVYSKVVCCSTFLTIMLQMRMTKCSPELEDDWWLRNVVGGKMKCMYTHTDCEQSCSLALKMSLTRWKFCLDGTVSFILVESLLESALNKLS